ncbi:MAG: AmmeMemoRadiSam system radical SAM enzyme [Mangrovibacterium sp.]
MNKREFIKTTLLGAGAVACTSGAATDLSANKEPWREAEFYTAGPRGLRCLLCPNACTLREGETGDCRTRVNRKGKLLTLAYGNPCALHVDPVEKKPLLHFLPESRAMSVAIAGCNLACLNCQNWTISQRSPLETDNLDLPPERLVKTCLQEDCASLAYTYSEPIVFYEYMYDTARLARQAGIRNLMITAGYINREPLKKLCRAIDAANVDLKSFSEEIYQRLNAGSLQPVLNTLQTMKAEGVWLEITNLVVPSWSDDTDMIRRMCGWLAEHGFEDTPLHFSRFHPTYKLNRLPPTPVSTLKQARETARQEGLHYVYIGNVPEAGMEDTLCPSCHRRVIERLGFRVLDRRLTDGKCDFCGAEIAGVWS